MLQKVSDQSSDQREETYTTSLQAFVESLDQRADKSPEILRLCSIAWEAALRAELEFTFDIMAIDTRVTLTLGDLGTQAIAATKAFNLQALQKIMSDPRFQTPNISDDGGNTLLHMILMKFGYNMEKSLEITKLLLNAGCDILRTNSDGQQPLHLWDENLAEKEEVTWPQNPSQQAFRQLMQMITEMGATCTSRDARGKNALHYHIISSSHLQAVLDAQPTENITTALEAIDADGFTPLALSLKKGLLTSASILAKTLEMTPSAMTSPIPILGLAVNANATDVLDLLIPLACHADLETNESPFHHIGPGATASNIRRLKSLYPSAWAYCVDGKTPFEAYLERCLAEGGVDPDVMDELSVLNSHEADTSDYPKIWERFAQYAMASRSEHVVTSAGISLLKLGYMRIFEKQNRVSGILPILLKKSQASEKNRGCLAYWEPLLGLWTLNSQICFSPTA
ncbi:hypothetical protein CGLO_12126 [Colletotrichum gloeosporioides Cg-14]|uniref:Uncharacterized protein n=1 Tax=Colletotrichum gloeosporioides (strain Cg-14) TaxID=1237896 RepID=T0LAA5_COLGC|nr:hypothetical protein CGLO_12126 [Colletotrichum gloeosporioides Cg-14]